MPESQLHRDLKQSACKWLWEQGYAAIAEEVVVPGVGIIDVVGVGRTKRRNPRRADFERPPTVDRHHVVFVECKAMRADFLRDQGRQQQFTFALEERAHRRDSRRRTKHLHASAALGKFDTCLMRPHSNLNYLFVAPGVLRAGETPRRWGLVVCDRPTAHVRRKAVWQEVADVTGIEGAVARSLTASLMRQTDPLIRVHAPTPDQGSLLRAMGR